MSIYYDTFTLTTTNKFIISYNYCQYISVAWGKPEAILDRNISDRAMFILQGLFKVFCEAGQVFDDIQAYSILLTARQPPRLRLITEESILMILRSVSSYP